MTVPAVDDAVPLASGIARFPLVRIGAAVLLVAGATAAAQCAVHLLRGPLPSGPYYLLYLLTSVLAAAAAYRVYVRLVERSPAPSRAIPRCSSRQIRSSSAAGRLAGRSSESSRRPPCITR